MTSTFDAAQADFERGSWRGAGLRYFSYSHFLRKRYGRRVQKVSLNAGFTCPNVDGTVAVGGCAFCDNRSFSPSRRLPRSDIRAQLEVGIARMRERYNCEHFIAYFQPATNTYAPVERLREVYDDALDHPQIVGLAIGTRADCVPDDVLDLLAELAQRTHLSVEYGLQTIHDRSLVWMNRGHNYSTFCDAVTRSRSRGFEIGTHVILGLPGESRDDMLATAREVARLELDSIKIHNLYAVKNTRLAEEVQQGEVSLLDRSGYIDLLVDFLELLPETLVIERLMGDAPPGFLVGPDWCCDKPGFYQALSDALQRRDTWQGKHAAR
jgi:radical SAM protein (TIGR01212 family)